MRKKRKKSRFTPITRKINVIILISLIAGIGGVTFYFARSLFNTIESSTRNNLNQQTEILYTAIENFMLPGNAPIAVNFFNDIQGRNPEYVIRLYRSNGVEAFSDNYTIEDVNTRLGNMIFIPRQTEKSEPDIVFNQQFNEAVAPPPSSTFDRIELEGDIFIRSYEPLLNLPKCTNCHGSTHTVRGVIDIRSNVTESVMQQRRAIIIAGSLFFGVVLLLAIWLTQLLTNTIISPVKTIGVVCAGVTGGDFDKRVTIPNNDEIGQLGDTVNTMVEGLHERFMLSKYVSNSTLESLRADKRGEVRSITMFFSDIRGFTSYSESRKAEEVVRYLNEMLTMQTMMISKHGGDVDKYVGDEVVALFAKQQPELDACRAALDICNELKAKSGSGYGGLRVGIGIHTGEVILGMIGSEDRADYTVIGDSVNTTSRLCDAAKPLQIIISDTAYRQVKNEAIVDGPYKLKVKGKQHFLKVYILKGLSETDEEYV
jgi:adenylate cyclase